MDISLIGKHAVVCGSSQGIGLATAQTLAHLGATVTLLARDPERLQSAAATLEQAGGQTHHWLAADFSDPDQVSHQVLHRVASLPAQILVNNTGGPPGGPAYSAGLEEFNDAFTKHLLCNQVLLQAVLPGMQESEYGRIINVISTSVKQPIPNLGVSNTIRGAVANWAKTLANELGRDNITVNNVLPGFTRTTRLPQVISNRARQTGKSEDKVEAAMRASVPLARFAEPREVANAIAFLASPAAAYISGINLPVDGGRLGSL